MKKTILWLLVLTLCVTTLFAGCTPAVQSTDKATDPKETDIKSGEEGPLEYSIFAIQHSWAPHWDKYAILNEMQEAANVKIHWELSPIQGVNEKLNLMFATGELPDAIMPQGRLGLNDYKYGQQGLIEPLNDYIKDMMPNVQSMLDRFPETYNILTTPDGNIYTLPSHHKGMIDEQIPGCMLSVNKTWLDTMGEKVPETTEEFYNLLVRFKNEDPNGNGKQDEIPLSFANDGKIRQFFGMFGLPMNTYSYIYVDEDENFTFVPTQERYKEAIKYLHSLYSEGLMDQNVFINADKDVTAIGQGEEIVLGSFVGYHMSAVVGTKRALDNYIIIPPIAGPHGDQLWPNNSIDSNIKAGFFLLSADCKNKEGLLKFIDLFYEPNYGFRLARGPEYTMVKTSDGKYEKQQPPDGMPEGEFFLRSVPGWFAPQFYDPDIYANVVQNVNVGLRQTAYKEIYKDHIISHAMPKRVYMDEDTMKRYTTLQPDIESFVDAKMTQWITEGGIDAEWDDYLASLEKMGLKEFIEISEKSYQDFNK